jgi:hypothetical protein
MNSHDHDFRLDLDGQVTCCICGAMDDDMSDSPWGHDLGGES